MVFLSRLLVPGFFVVAMFRAINLVSQTVVSFYMDWCRISGGFHTFGSFSHIQIVRPRQATSTEHLWCRCSFNKDTGSDTLTICAHGVVIRQLSAQYMHEPSVTTFQSERVRVSRATMRTDVFSHSGLIGCLHQTRCHIVMGLILERMWLHWRHLMSRSSMLARTAGTHCVQQHPKPQESQQYVMSFS